MAATQSTQKDFGLLGDFEKWIAQKQDDVGRFADQAAAAGRDAWTQAMQAGQTLFAPTPANPPATNPRTGSGQLRPVAPAQPNASPVPNAWAPVMDVTRGVGNVVGVGRGAVHSVEGLLGGAEFLARLANPFSSTGASAYEQLAGAANQATDYVKNGLRNPGSVLQDIKDAGNRALVELYPDASPPASTLGGEFQRNFDIGQNQGELGFDLGSLLFGGAATKVLGRLAPLSEDIAAAKFVGQGFSPAQAAYLAKPYEGMGSHFIPRSFKFPDNVFGAPLPNFIADKPLPSFISDSPFNVLKPPNINRGDFYELHYKVDPRFYGAKIPAGNGGGSWRGKTGLKLEKYGPLNSLWYGSPAPLNAAVGTAGAAGLATFENTDQDQPQ